MPDFCAAFGCSNERNAKTKEQGITFHRFPKDKFKRRAWTTALRRRNFVPNDRSVVCSCHFKTQDFDRTGQTTRLRAGVSPSVFTFSDTEHLSKVPCEPRTSRTSQKAAAEIPDFHIQPSKDLQQLTSDHQYALDSVKVKQKLNEAQERLEELQRDLRNAKDRERRHKKIVETLLDDLKRRNMLTEELQQKLDFHSGVHHESCCSAKMELHATVKQCKHKRICKLPTGQKKANKHPHCQSENVFGTTDTEKDSGKEC
ncbi:THAP domain-containing protein 2-like [Betta splendens]|uniref:THAP domain-containing protein 2-like n=1 Tax=Betta splendens TaxID=158456 RepID=A0A6P7MI43_BETSP|nr:THAP domain-containing protein 2-like [Betta splendens]